MSFSENLKRIRAEKNLSQEQLAEMIGVSRQAISKWEQDNGYPETEKLINIAQKLDISLDFLLLGRQNDIETQKDLPQNYNFTGERKITIPSYDGKTMSAYYKFSIQKELFPSKKRARCVLCGTSHTGFFGDNLETLGWYATEEDAQKEIKEIYTAMLNGEPAYQLKYFANVKIKAFGIELAD